MKVTGGRALLARQTTKEEKNESETTTIGRVTFLREATRPDVVIVAAHTSLFSAGIAHGAIAAHRSDGDCRPDFRNTSGTPIVNFGPVAAAPSHAAPPQSLSNSIGLPVQWQFQRSPDVRDCIVLFPNGTTGDLHTGANRFALAQLTVSANDCPVDGADACTHDLAPSLQRIGVQAKRSCADRSGRPVYEVAGPDGKPAAIQWHPYQATCCRFN
ncbi:hypothetical protein [Paraburkholderia aromaticivorans]|uniref:hypothetical protein n=1 Tax=Paraburkholderia aromaticivorans TaxID=2026199 RepID=UPI001455F28F|nr:hypothetical protein [Paraburkholderia aromaticivorans]